MIRARSDQTRQFLLTKNLLAIRPDFDLPTTVRALVALPAFDVSGPILALRARLADFHTATLWAALHPEHILMKRPAIRNEPHLIAAEDFATFLVATQRQRRQAFNTEFIRWQTDQAEVEALATAIVNAIDAEATTVDEIASRLPAGSVQQLTHTSRGGRLSETTNLELALNWLEANGQLLKGQATPPDIWREEVITYAPLSTWWPDLDFTPDLTEAEAQQRLVRAYLSAYGPATEADISFWSGFGKSETQRAVSALAAETTLAMVEGIPGAMLLLKGQADSLRSTHPPTKPVINLLPANDPFIRAHKASRSRLFATPDPRLQRHIFSNTDQTQATIVVNGQIVGTWDWQHTDQPHMITWRLFTAVEPDLLAAVQTSFQELALFCRPERCYQARYRLSGSPIALPIQPEPAEPAFGPVTECPAKPLHASF